MKKTSYYITLFLSLLISWVVIGQKTVRLEIAPYLVPCDDTEADNCLQLLDINGSNLNLIPLNGIKGFTAEQGFEYTLDVTPNVILKEEEEEEEEIYSYTLHKEVSKMWVPQYATDAPTLEGSFQVVGYNGKSIDTNNIDLIINASKRVMRGSTGCNNYHLFFEQFGYSLLFSKILASHMFCASRAALEEEYFVIFNSVHHFKLENDVLHLYDITDRKLLEAIRLH